MSRSGPFSQSKDDKPHKIEFSFIGAVNNIPSEPLPDTTMPFQLDVNIDVACLEIMTLDFARFARVLGKGLSGTWDMQIRRRISEGDDWAVIDLLSDDPHANSAFYQVEFLKPLHFYAILRLYDFNQRGSASARFSALSESELSSRTSGTPDFQAEYSHLDPVARDGHICVFSGSTFAAAKHHIVTNKYHTTDDNLTRWNHINQHRCQGRADKNGHDNLLFIDKITRSYLDSHHYALLPVDKKYYRVQDIPPISSVRRFELPAQVQVEVKADEAPDFDIVIQRLVIENFQHGQALVLVGQLDEYIPNNSKAVFVNRTKANTPNAELLYYHYAGAVFMRFTTPEQRGAFNSTFNEAPSLLQQVDGASSHEQSRWSSNRQGRQDTSGKEDARDTPSTHEPLSGSTTTVFPASFGTDGWWSPQAILSWSADIIQPLAYPTSAPCRDAD